MNIKRKNPFCKEMALDRLSTTAFKQAWNQSDHLKMNFSYTMQEMPSEVGAYEILKSLHLTSLTACDILHLAALIRCESKMVGGLDGLSRLNELRGSLEIRFRGYERNSCISEFEGAKLIEKHYLQSLTIARNARQKSYSNIDLLISLQPNLTVRFFKIMF